MKNLVRSYNHNTIAALWYKVANTDRAIVKDVPDPSGFEDMRVYILIQIVKTNL